ncbi:MAG: phosphate signaling complex protein PhoU [Chloroflexi bacterium]|nr:phosphate signaling complex protein PhoU [Chloroflexota bacterium]
MPETYRSETTMDDPASAAAGAAVTTVETTTTTVESSRTGDSGRPPMPQLGSRDTLEREEREIKDNVLRLGSMVADQIHRAVEALERHDADLAMEVITGDGRLNEAQRLITALVTRTIATQQPVARDLRFLLALDHVAYDLERMGDHASSVAKQARKLAPVGNIEATGKLAEMGRLTSALTREVLRALVDQDERLARSVAAQDDQVDDLYHGIFSDMLELMRADPANVDSGARVLFAAHYLERIGDRVTNVAEDVVFLATGETEDLNP